MKSFSCVLAVFLFAGCGGGSGKANNGPASNRPELSAQDYNALMALSDADLGQKLNAGDLGNCTLRAVRDEPVCADGKAYEIYLLDDSVYYPTLQKDPDEPNSVCMASVGPFARTAMSGGDCFTVGQ